LSNYSPTSGILLNPSSSADSKSFIDFNISGLGLFVHNDLVFVNGSANSLNRQNQVGLDISEFYNTTNAPYSAKVDLLIHAPSLSFSFGNFGVGIHTSLRSALSVDGVPNHLVNHIRNGFNFPDQLGQEFTTSQLRIGGLSWLEYGLNASYIISKKENEMLTVGANLKLLNGITGVGFNVDKWNYQVQDEIFLNSFEFIGEYGVHDINNSVSPIGNGRGLGVDLGFNYKSMKKNVSNYFPHSPKGCRLIDYDYKIGISLLDLGNIRFREGNGLTRSFEITDSTTIENYSAVDIQSLEGLNNFANELLTTAGNSSVTNVDELNMLLPSAFSAQFDYNIGHGFFANATLVHGFGRKNKLGVERSHTFAITPRFESKPVDVALPLVIRDYESVRLGFAFRVYYLTIGSDNIFSLIGGAERETYGTDIYFNLKYTMFRPWYCSESKSKSKPKRRGKGSPSCPSW